VLDRCSRGFSSSGTAIAGVSTSGSSGRASVHVQRQFENLLDPLDRMDIELVLMLSGISVKSLTFSCGITPSDAAAMRGQQLFFKRAIGSTSPRSVISPHRNVARTGSR